MLLLGWLNTNVTMPVWEIFVSLVFANIVTDVYKRLVKKLSKKG